jgi:hypothetical protein
MTLHFRFNFDNNLKGRLKSTKYTRFIFMVGNPFQQEGVFDFRALSYHSKPFLPDDHSRGIKNNNRNGFLH